jgi:hypothetical protein
LGTQHGQPKELDKEVRAISIFAAGLILCTRQNGWEYRNQRKTELYPMNVILNEARAEQWTKIRRLA